VGSDSNKGWEQFTDKVIEVVDKYSCMDLSNRKSDGPGSYLLLELTYHLVLIDRAWTNFKKAKCTIHHR
jgi:hypothetical protein